MCQCAKRSDDDFPFNHLDAGSCYFQVLVTLFAKMMLHLKPSVFKTWVRYRLAFMESLKQSLGN